MYGTSDIFHAGVTFVPLEEKIKMEKNKQDDL
jgi:hypothetical protein